MGVLLVEGPGRAFIDSRLPQVAGQDLGRAQEYSIGGAILAREIMVCAVLTMPSSCLRVSSSRAIDVVILQIEREEGIREQRAFPSFSRRYSKFLQAFHF